MAGTLYGAGDNTLEDFAELKHESILNKMPWYEPSSERSVLQDVPFPGYLREYRGVWPNEDAPTTYVVTVFSLGDKVLSLTFTGFSANLEAHRSQIASIYRSLALAQ